MRVCKLSFIVGDIYTFSENQMTGHSGNRLIRPFWCGGVHRKTHTFTKY